LAARWHRDRTTRGVVVAEDQDLDGAIDRFAGAIALHRHRARQQDPPAP
jgi:hypothetical protein